MRRTLALMPIALGGVVVVGSLVYAVLIATNHAEPAATTVEGLTWQRAWATGVGILAVVGALLGGYSVLRPANRFGAGFGRLDAVLALVFGSIGIIGGGLMLSIANGGPGSGNGVVGAAGAGVVGLLAIGLGGFALARDRRTA